MDDHIKLRDMKMETDFGRFKRLGKGYKERLRRRCRPVCVKFRDKAT